MKRILILFLIIIGFIPGSISVSSGGNGAPGFTVYSDAGDHETGDFIPASDGMVIIISEPEAQKNTPAGQETEKPLVKMNNEKKQGEWEAIGINKNEGSNKMNRRAKKRQQRKLRKSAISLTP